MYVPDEPPIGTLVAYEYRWLCQENTRNDGAKAYPVALITLPYAVGMSHKPTHASEKAIEGPKKLKRHLGLDEDRSWIYTDQLIHLAWSGSQTGRMAVKAARRAKQLHHRSSPEQLVRAGSSRTLLIISS